VTQEGGAAVYPKITRKIIGRVGRNTSKGVVKGGVDKGF